MLRAIILAAGNGVRMGGPKALLRWNGVPLALAQARAALQSGCDEVMVVVRAPIVSQCPPLPHRARWCVSVEEERLGPAGSLRAAIATITNDNEWFAISPVDVDPIAWTCLSTLLVTVSTHSAARPLYSNRRGHPVLVRSSALSPYKTAEPPPLRALLASLGAAAAEVPVDVPAVLSDFDTPQAFATQQHNEAPVFCSR